MYSPWFMQFCPECRHMFREGDRVRQCPRCGKAYHDDEHYQLRCWPNHFRGGEVCRPARYDPFREEDDPGCDFCTDGFVDDNIEHHEQSTPIDVAPAVARFFLKGVQTVWRPFGDAEVLEVAPGSSLIGRQCPWCRFDIRAGDHVVKCPCGRCSTYFHDDIFRKLTCWNNWNGSRGHNFCPTTGARIEVPGQRAVLEADDER
jgi:hypothetical protein